MNLIQASFLVVLVQSLIAELCEDEDEQIKSIVRKPPCLVVFGQTLYAKAFLVNEIFNKTILPQAEGDEGKRWRMVRFRYGDHQNISLSLPGSYELVDNLQAYSGPWQTVPLEDLEVASSDLEGSDCAKGNAVLEVRLPHHLLKESGQVVVSQWNVGTVDQVYNKSVKDVVPVVVYVISRDKLSDKVSKHYLAVETVFILFYLNFKYNICILFVFEFF